MLRPIANYGDVHARIVALLESSRRATARSVNVLMTSAYWEIGRNIVEFEQKGGGEGRATYGDALIRQLADDLTKRFGRGYSKRNLHLMCNFYRTWPIVQTLSAQSLDKPAVTAQVSPVQAEGLGAMESIARRFTLPWSVYVRLLSVNSVQARDFYEAETIRCGWSVRQLDRQIDSRFYERTMLPKNKTAMLVAPELTDEVMAENWATTSPS